MALEIAFENILAMLAMPFLLIVAIVSFNRFKKTKYKHFLFLAIEWSGLFVWCTLTTVSTILASSLINLPLATLIGWIGYFTLLGGTLFLLLFVDSITRTSVDSLKTLILGLLAATAIIGAFIPGQSAKDPLFYAILASNYSFLFRTILYTLFAFRIYINSPKKTERYSILVLIGIIFMGIIPSFNIITGLIPAGLGLNELIFLIGIILMAVPFVIHPQLFFLLPYKSSRLAVFNSDGILLFSHRWESGSVNDDISSILKDSLKQEAVNEIHLDQTILVIVRKKNISFILMTVKSSNFLRKALNKFSDEFSQKFESILPEPIVRDNELAMASELISEHFQFLPNYT
ncbi:MAG: hypothetical protein ACW96X_04370 [Promethearchaeota archaeon]